MTRRAVPLALLAIVLPLASVMAQSPSTRFIRNPALLKARQAKIVEGMRAQNPQAAGQLEQAFSQDIVAMMAPEFKRLGIDPQDMTDMMAVYWVMAWEVANGKTNGATDPALVQGASRQLAGIAAKNPAMAKMTDAQKQDVADTMLIQALLVDARVRAAKKSGSAAEKQLGDAVAGEAQQMLKTDLRKVVLTRNGFAPAGGGQAAAAPVPAPRTPAPASPPAPAPTARAAGSGAGVWKTVEGVYFRTVPTFGVGGMMIMDQEPLVLFRDGTYFEVEDTPLEDTDLAASRAARPARWGRWTRNASGFALTGHKGRTHSYKLQSGNFFKSFPAEANGRKLNGKFTRVSGGGNTAVGGTSMIGFQTDINFAPDGSFGRNVGGGSSDTGGWTGVNIATSSRSASAGRYTISNYTITMTDPSGRTQRKFFAFGSEKSPARVDPNLAFIGNNVFVVMGSH